MAGPRQFLRTAAGRSSRRIRSTDLIDILLDTATLLFVGAGSSLLTAAARSIVAETENRLFLSVVSVWELYVKTSTGKLVLPDPVAVYVDRVRRAKDIVPLGLRDDDLLPLATLPLRHRDPFDRALIAQGIARNLVILTPDRAMRAYPEVRSVW